jgi:TonB-linked SusC/RagA family outer membrane protein
MKQTNYLNHKAVAMSLLWLFCFWGAVAQAQTITGKVVDSATASPLAGVTILVKPKGSTTLTAADGTYKINAKSGDRLEFSFVGYGTQSVAVGASANYNVVLNPATGTQLGEVVVTALGVKKEKKLVSYSTQEVKGSELIKAREPNVLNSLVGKVAGLNVGISAEMLGRPQMLLRGSSINLYVVDGIPINSDTWNISADDIESITVLKGPVASALYGYRGQAGAIVITTKKGAKDKRGFSIEINSSTMFDKGFIAIPKTQDEYGPGDHGTYAFANGKGAGKNDGDYDVWGPKFEGQLIPQYDGAYTPNQTYTTNFKYGNPWVGNIAPTPWVARGKDNLSRFIQTGLLSTNNIALSASGDKYDLRFSLTHTAQKGLVPNTKLNATNFNINAGYKFSDRLKLDATLNYNRQFTPNTPDVVYGPNSIIYNITIWGGADWDIDQMRNYWQPGKEGVQSIFAEYQRYHNPWFMSKEWLRGHYKTDVYGYAALTYQLTKNVELMGRSAITTYNIFRNEKMPFSAHPYGREEGFGDYIEDRRNLFENNTEAMIKYNGRAGFLGITGFVGGNIRSFTYNSNFVKTDYLNVPNVYAFSNSRNPIKAYSFASDMRVYSGYYSVDLSVSKYLNINTTGRVDKLSTLKEGSNTYFYPSASVNTVVSDYVKLPLGISFLKLRGSYANVKSGGGSTSSTIGATPNQSYPVGYGGQYFSSYDGPSYSFQDVYNTGQYYNNQTAAYYTNTIIDDNLKPDSRSSIEAGVDLKFMRNRLGVDVTYFNYLDGPQIFNKGLTPTTGYNTLVTNAVKTRRQGWEVSVTGTAIKPKRAGAFGWDVMANWSSYKDKYAELPAGQSVLFDFYRKGDRTDKWYSSGFVRTPDGAIINDAGGRPIVNPRPQFLGYLNPDWIWGFNNRFSYKGFSLNVQFDGRVGGSMSNYVRKQTFRGGRHIETVQGAMGVARNQDYLGVRSWVGQGVRVSNGVAIKYDPITGAVLNYADLQYTPNTTATFLQDYISRYYNTDEGNIMSKTYVKLREVTLTYNFPQVWLAKSFIKGANVSFVARNLGYWLKAGDAFKDVDVDQYAGGTGSTSLQTPTTRRFGFNLNVTF